MLRRVSHGMRISFGFTFDDHRVFGVDDVLLHRLLDDGRGLPDCGQSVPAGLSVSQNQRRDFAFATESHSVITHLPGGRPKHRQPAIAAAAAAAELLSSVSPFY